MFPGTVPPNPCGGGAPTDPQLINDSTTCCRLRPRSGQEDPEPIYDSPEPFLKSKPLNISPVVFEDVRLHSLKDPVISKVMDLVMTGEKHTEQFDSTNFKPYMRRINEELSVDDNTLLWYYRVIIPPLLRESVLTELHQTHPGINRMKSLARSYVWWPGIDEDVVSLVQTCSPCQEHQNMPQRALIHPWEHPSKPWTRLHIDHAGPFQGKMYLVIVDSYSKWLDECPVNSANSSVTIEKLRIFRHPWFTGNCSV